MTDAIPPAPAPIACMPWHARDPTNIAASCRSCDRVIAIPVDAPARATRFCAYCALDMGLIPEVEIEPGEPIPVCTRLGAGYESAKAAQGGS